MPYTNAWEQNIPKIITFSVQENLQIILISETKSYRTHSADNAEYLTLETHTYARKKNVAFCFAATLLQMHVYTLGCTMRTKYIYIIVPTIINNL